MTSKSDGDRIEQAALAYLQQQGLEELATNFRCRCGEIDLIMRESQCLVFVEVRYRRDTRFGDASATVTRQKQSRIIRSAQYFRARHPQLQSLPCRFDVIAASGSLEQPSLNWIRDAFATV
jgi:putative endonuclease